MHTLDGGQDLKVALGSERYRVGGFVKGDYFVDLLLDHLHITVSPTYPVEAISCDECRPETKLKSP